MLLCTVSRAPLNRQAALGQLPVRGMRRLPCGCLFGTRTHAHTLTHGAVRPRHLVLLFVLLCGGRTCMEGVHGCMGSRARTLLDARPSLVHMSVCRQAVWMVVQEGERGRTAVRRLHAHVSVCMCMRCVCAFMGCACAACALPQPT